MVSLFKRPLRASMAHSPVYSPLAAASRKPRKARRWWGGADARCVPCLPPTWGDPSPTA